MKVFVLLCIFLNVLISPTGLAAGTGLGEVALAIVLVFLKVVVAIVAIVVVESSLAKLRLFRISGFLGLAFVVAVAAVLTRMMTA